VVQEHEHDRDGPQALDVRSEPVGGLADAGGPRCGLGYFAYSKARVSRMTVTLISPG
jgi:hypothetical protein